jgi:hypothetical protein
MIMVCIGMIRSGSTLQYNMARGLVERTLSGAGEGFTCGENPRAAPTAARDGVGEIGLLLVHLQGHT